MLHLAVVTHDGEFLAELLSCGGKEGHLQLHCIITIRAFIVNMRQLFLTMTTIHHNTHNYKLKKEQKKKKSLELTSTTTISLGWSMKSDGLTANGGLSEKYVFAKDYTEETRMIFFPWR